MALLVYQVTLGAGATQITSSHVPFIELHLNASAADYYLGGSDVSTTKYFVKVPSTGTVNVAIGAGGGGAMLDTLKNMYLIGTQSGVVNVGVVTQ